MAYWHQLNQKLLIIEDIKSSILQLAIPWQFYLNLISDVLHIVKYKGNTDN